VAGTFSTNGLNENALMKLKMSDNSLFAILLRSPWWFSAVLVIVFLVVSKAFLPAEYVVFGAMGGIPFAVIAMIAAWRQWQAPDPAQMAQQVERAMGMSWAEFSEVVAAGLRQQGYDVQRLPAGVADFQLTRAGKVSLLQCKRWKAASLGVEPLRELVAARQSTGADAAVVIAMGKLSDSARTFARTEQVQLMTAQDLAQLMPRP
jgi:restriction system protein